MISLARGALPCLILVGTVASAGAEPPPPSPPGKEAGAPHPTVVSYSVLMMGHPAGRQTTSVAPSGERTYTFAYNDRGRGPNLTSRMVLGSEGTPVLTETTGQDYLHAPVDERFRIENGRSSWKSTSEHGEKVLAGPAFYVSLSGPPEELAVLARALLKGPDRRLPLLPEGEARIERVGDLQVSAGGPSRAVVEYSITGLDFTPSVVWLDANQDFFAVASSWMSVVREGWEGVVDSLVAAQDGQESVRAEALARSASHRPASALAFKGARLFDANDGRTLTGITVVVSGTRIQAVGPDGTVTIPAGAEMIDAAGKTLLPGLWDMHVHVGEVDGPLDIAAGITSVRDLANDMDKVLALRNRWQEGTAVGPRVALAGFMDGPGPYAGPTKVLVSTDAEARAAIETYARLGFEQIKVYSSIKPELVPGIVREAHARGLRVSGHVPSGMTAEEVVRAGFDELQHANFLFLNFLPEVKDTRTPQRFTAVAEKAATLDLASEPVRRFVELLKARQTVVDPTLNVFEAMFLDRPGTVSRSLAAVADRLPAQVRRGLFAGGLPVPEGLDQRYRESFTALEKMVKLLYDEHVPIVAGTDALAGFSLHRELELYVEAGIPAPEVLRIATVGAARVLKREGERGTIAPGKLADLILVEGDPSVHISDLRRTVVVVKDGVVYDPAALYRSLGVIGGVPALAATPPRALRAPPPGRSRRE